MLRVRLSAHPSYPRRRWQRPTKGSFGRRTAPEEEAAGRQSAMAKSFRRIQLSFLQQFAEQHPHLQVVTLRLKKPAQAGASPEVARIRRCSGVRAARCAGRCPGKPDDEWQRARRPCCCPVTNRSRTYRPPLARHRYARTEAAGGVPAFRQRHQVGLRKCRRPSAGGRRSAPERSGNANARVIRGTFPAEQMLKTARCDAWRA